MTPKAAAPPSELPTTSMASDSSSRPSMLKEFWLQFWDFGWQEAWSCVFPVAIFITLAVTQFTATPAFPRYDQILVICLAVQAMMYFFKLETLDEIKVICLFHVFGLALEIFKTHVGSWSYPEPGYTKIMGVPLYSGFMYASVASYMCQAWRRLKLRLGYWPRTSFSMPLAVGIYVNFFTNHYMVDLRWILIPLVAIVFRKTMVYFTVHGVVRRMPLTLGFFLTGFFVWIAENIATYFHGWQYPDQAQQWSLVHTAKISSWFLLVIISLIFVAQLKHVKAKLKGESDPVEIVTGT